MNKEDYELKLKEATVSLEEFSTKYRDILDEYSRLISNKEKCSSDIECSKWEEGNCYKVERYDADFYIKVIKSYCREYICSLVRIVKDGYESGNWKTVYHPVSGYQKDGRKMIQITEEEFNSIIKSVPCEENGYYKDFEL